MGRRVGLVLAGLGACLIVFAVLMPTWVSSRVLKFPLNEYISVTLTDPSASYFSAAKLTELTGVNMEATYTIKGNAAAGSSSTAVWNQFVYVYDQTNKAPFQSMTRTFAFDRRTAQLVNCCGANVGGDSSVEQRGYVGYVLPIGTKKQTYDVFDTTLNKPVPFTYAGLGSADGTEAYRFVENVPPTQTGTQTLPGSLVGQSAASVTLPQYYQTQVTYWIDPVTGALLNVTQNEKVTLRDSSGAQALVLFNANLAATQDSIDRLVALDNSELSKMSLVATLLPLFTGIVGVLLLIVGIVLVRRPREDVEAGPGPGSPALAAVESEDAGRPVTHASLVPGLDDEAHEATAESPVVKEEAAQPKAAKLRAAKAEEAKAEEEKAEEAKAEEAETPQAEAAAAQAQAPAEAEAPKAEAAEAAEAPKAEAEAPKAEAPAAEAKAEGAEGSGAPDGSAGAPASDAPAAEAQAAAESPKAEDAPAEAATAEMPAAGSESADAEAEASASGAKRGRRGAHRR